jgi:hypothetical protein
MRRRVGVRFRAIAAISLLSFGCGDSVDSRGPIRITAPELDDRSGAPSPAHWDRDGPTAPITLTPGTVEGPWTSIAITGDDGESAGVLLRGPAAAVIGYQAAVESPKFAAALVPTRLALLGPDSLGGPVQPALWLDAPLRVEDTATGVSLAELSVEEAAPLLATAMVLGGWQGLAQDRFPRGDDGQPRLPPFVPILPGNWIDLRGTSLEGYLAADLAAHIADTPGLRAETYFLLGRLVEQLDPLTHSIEALAQSHPDLAHPDLAIGSGIDALTDLLAEHADALSSYLASVWVEQVVVQSGSDRIRMSIDFHTVVPVTLEAFVMSAGPRRALEQGEALGALSLIERETGVAVSPRIGANGIVFPVNRAIHPIHLGPHRFGSTRLAFEILGLDRMPEIRDRLLEDLDLRVVQRDGTPLARDHVRRVWSIVDPRFGATREESPQQFMDSLPKRIAPLEGAPAPRLENGVLRFRGGRHHLVDDLILPPGIGLWIDANTELRVDPARSILVRGSLRIEGRPGRPVRIGRADEEAPWGVLAVQGKAVTRPGGTPRRRAIVSHLELDGGSEDQLRGVWYTGQLSVYHQDLTLSGSTLSRSSNQDNLNVNRGEVEIRDSRFIDSGDDAVDLDWATGSIRHSLFAGTGPDGDGIDVAGTTLLLEDVVVSDAGDKCVSAGERSTVEVQGALLRRCDAAIASKDSSRVRVAKSLVLDVGTAYDAYQKSAVFGPPQLRILGVIAAGIARPVRISSGATLEVGDLVQIEPTPATSPGVRPILLSAETPLGRALADDDLRETESFDRDRFDALRALVPRDARPR